MHTDFTADVLIVGGGLAGTAAAYAAATSGKRTILAESRTYLGAEYMATSRLWLDRLAWAELQKTIPLPDHCLLLGEADPEETGMLVPDLFKIALEDALIEAGVKLLYQARPIGWRRSDGFEVEVAGKFGTKRIGASHVIDATRNGILSLCAGSSTSRYAGQSVRAWRTMELIGVNRGLLDEGRPLLPADLAPACAVHKGHMAEGHLFVEHAVDLTVEEGCSWQTEAEIQGRLRSMDVFRWLKNNDPAFAKATLTSSALELSLPSERRIRAAGIELGSCETAAGSFLWSSFHTEDGIWTLSGAADVEASVSEQWSHSPAMLAQIGVQLGKQIGERGWGTVRGRGTSELAWNLLPAYKKEVEVLVIGGGTSGATASIIAARHGSKTALIEMNLGLGGTATLGGVASYWYGRRGGYNEQVTNWVKEEHQGMGFHWTGVTAQRWNIDAKMTALLRNVRHAGVDLLMNGVVVKMNVTEEGKLLGAVIAAPEGLVEITAQVTVDATGDGDAAVLAGAEHVYGSDRECLTLWYSMVPQIRPGLQKNNFTSTVDVGDAEDYTRAILAARRREISYDHYSYLAPRESRHILGEVRLTLTDQLKMRQWQDVVNLAFSNNDIKGHSSSDWVKMGLISPNLEIEIPYRALLPVRIDGLLVTGKAISATHDALPAIRMQADLENLGGVCGLAASMCVKNNNEPRTLNVSKLQKALVEAGVLPEEILTRTDSERGLSEEEMKFWIHQLDDEQKLYSYSDMGYQEVRKEPVPIVVVCTAGEAIVPLLHEALQESDSPRRLSVARALAWYGDRAAVPVLIEHIQALLAEDELPPRVAKIKHTQVPPDQGAMPELCYLLHTLAMTRDERAIAIIEQVERRLKPSREKLTDLKSGIFYYVDSICDIAEQLGDPRCIPVLRRLHREELFNGKMTRSIMQPDYFEERQAYLELVIARAMARCGDREGLQVLAAYLSDSRKLLARHAHQELMSITGREFPAQPEPWLSYVEGAGVLPPKPWEAARGST